MSRPPRIRGTLLKPLFGATSGVFRPPCIQGTLSKPLFWVINGGAEGPGRRLQRAGPAEAVPTRTAARPRRDAGHEGRRGRQVQAPRPRALGKSAAKGPNDRLQADLIDFSQNTSPGRPLWNLCRTRTPRRWAAPPSAPRELTGDDGNFVVTTEFATLDRELPEAVHRTKRPEDRNAIAVVDRGIQTLKKDLATRVVRKGGQWSDHFERAAAAHETVHGAPEDVEKQPATEFRVLQDNADKFQHNKDLTDRRVKAVQDVGAFRAPTNAARSSGAAGAGQRQRGGPADETQAGGCEAAGRLPGASEAQDPRLI